MIRTQLSYTTLGKTWTLKGYIYKKGKMHLSKSLRAPLKTATRVGQGMRGSSTIRTTRATPHTCGSLTKDNRRVAVNITLNRIEEEKETIQERWNESIPASMWPDYDCDTAMITMGLVGKTINNMVNRRGK